jgi:hypothetical protein
MTKIPALGDFGYIDSKGAFQDLGNIGSSMQVGPRAEGASYTFQDTAVQTTASDAQVSGTFFDPESGTEVNGGVNYAWKFTKSQAVNLVLPVTYSQAYVAPTDVVTDPTIAGQLWFEAYQAGWVAGNGTINAGFGVVVGVVQIVAGLILGSESSSSQFSITGSLNAIQDLMAGSAGGAYSQASGDSGMLQVLWPPAPISSGSPGNKASLNNLFTIAIQLASFDNYMPGLGTGQVLYPYVG